MRDVPSQRPERRHKYGYLDDGEEKYIQEQVSAQALHCECDAIVHYRATTPEKKPDNTN